MSTDHRVLMRLPPASPASTLCHISATLSQRRSSFLSRAYPARIPARFPERIPLVSHASTALACHVRVPIRAHSLSRRVLIPFVFFGWLAFLLFNTGDSVSDGAQDNTYIARAFIYLPYYVAGFLGKRHRLFDKYLQARDSNCRWDEA